MLRLSLLAAIAVPLAFGPAKAQPPLRAEITEVLNAFADAYNRADGGAIADLYDRRQGMTSAEDGSVIRGWDRLRERLDGFDAFLFGDVQLRFRLSSIDVRALGDNNALAQASYAWEVAGAGGEVRQRGFATFVLERVAGVWRIIHDHSSKLTQEEQGAAAPTANVQPGSLVSFVVANGQAVEIDAQAYHHFEFVLPSGSCELVGRVEGISGGSKDFVVLILDDDNYRNWSTGLAATAYWQTDRTTVTNLNVTLPGAGRYHLVLSNVFSFATPKVVQPVAEARCAG